MSQNNNNNYDKDEYNELFDFLMTGAENDSNIVLTQSEQKVAQNLSQNNVSGTDFINQVNADSVAKGRDPIVKPQVINVSPTSQNSSGKTDLLDSLNMSVIPDQPQEPAPEATEIPKAKKNDDSTEAIQRQYGQITPRFAANKTQNQSKPIKDISPKEASSHNVEAIKIISNIQPTENNKFDEKITQALPGSAQGATEASDSYVAIANKEIICPVDYDISAGTNNVTPYFSLKNTLASWGLPGLGKLLDIDIDAFKTSPFFKNLAQKQYDEYKRKLAMTYAERQKLARRSILKKVLVVLVIVLAIVSLVLPRVLKSKGLSEGHQAIAAGKYELAEEIMCNEAKNQYYCVYAKALNASSKHDYEYAYKALDKLEPYQANIKYNIDDTRNETKYQQANYLLSSKNYSEALEILKEISNYKDSADIFFSTCYQLASSYEGTNNEVSIKYYYMAKDWEDARQKFETSSRVVYDDGMTAYNSHNYDEAQKKFEFLSQYNFLDSRIMTNQCIYKKALDSFEVGDFATSNTLFASIKSFKDASALIVNVSEIPSFETKYLKCTEGTSFDEESENDIETDFGKIACRFSEEFFQGHISSKEVIESEAGTSEVTRESTFDSLESLNKALEQMALENGSDIKYEFRYPDDPVFIELAEGNTPTGENNVVDVTDAETPVENSGEVTNEGSGSETPAVEGTTPVDPAAQTTESAG